VPPEKGQMRHTTGSGSSGTVRGIAYDPEDDVVEVALERLDHLIYRPREIYVDDQVGGLTSIEIEDASGAKQIVKLKDKLLLPAPSH
jgi:hypothetical protein